MRVWRNGGTALTLLQQIFLCAAVPFTLVLIVQAILTFAGLGGGHDSDADADGDMDGGFDVHDVDGHDFDADDMVAHDIGGHEMDAGGHDGEAVGGFRFFTVRGIVAFFCIFGWTGFALCDTRLSVAAIVPISFFAGLIAMLLIGLMFFAVRRMQDSGKHPLQQRHWPGRAGIHPDPRAPGR